MCAAVALAASAAAGGQEPAANGRIEFAVRVTPVSGQPEPARGLTIFLLSRSFREISREAEEKIPRPDLDAYIDTLAAGKELKDWMKKQHSVTITGADFRKRLTDDDLIRVPEFLEAYVKGNLLELTLGFPPPKSTPEERAEMSKNHGGYPKAYVVQIRKYLTAHPESRAPMDTILEEQDATKPWTIQESRWHERAHTLALQLAQSDYLASKTVTNLDGLGAFQAAPGKYWLSSLDGEALGGEQHLRWDVAVEVRAGSVARVDLTNLNAEKKP